jgi:hypothetical protein
MCGDYPLRLQGCGYCLPGTAKPRKEGIAVCIDFMTMPLLKDGPQDLSVIG